MLFPLYIGILNTRGELLIQKMPVMILLAEDRVGKDLKLATTCSGLVDLGGQPNTHTVAHLPACPMATR